MAKSKYSSVDEYGFERGENFNYEAYDAFMSNYLRILARRAMRWDQVMKSDNYPKNATLKRFIRKGVPSDRRVAVWMAVSGAQKMRSDSPKTYTDLKRNISNKSLIETIKIDLPRTFPDNIYFTSNDYLPQQLFSVLATFAHQNPNVGYCQGLNYLAGLLLLATKSEETSFWLLKVLVERILPPYYVSNMSGLLTDLDVLDEFVSKAEPQVYRHIKRIGMPWAMGTTKWFVCLFADVLPTETVLRIWDCLFNEGSRIIFRVALTLIKLHKQQILASTELGELIACFRNMKSHERVVNCHLFIGDIFKYSGRLSGNNLAKIRRKYDKTKA